MGFTIYGIELFIFNSILITIKNMFLSSVGLYIYLYIDSISLIYM
jgi:hypothetical protein